MVSPENFARYLPVPTVAAIMECVIKVNANVWLDIKEMIAVRDFALINAQDMEHV